MAEMASYIHALIGYIFTSNAIQFINDSHSTIHDIFIVVKNNNEIGLLLPFS